MDIYQQSVLPFTAPSDKETAHYTTAGFKPSVTGRGVLNSPFSHTRKGVLVCQVEHEQETHCSSVVGMRDGTEAFLPSCVPNLQLDSLLLTRNSLHLKINSNCRHVATDESIVTVSEDGGRLPNAGVPNNEHFKHQVKTWVSGRRMVTVLCPRVGLRHYIQQRRQYANTV